jgi:hypothetical protein
LAVSEKNHPVPTLEHEDPVHRFFCDRGNWDPGIIGEYPSNTSTTNEEIAHLQSIIPLQSSYLLSATLSVSIWVRRAMAIALVCDVI